MKLAICLFVALLISGCSRGGGMTNDQIIAEKKKCDDAGMGISLRFNFDEAVYGVYCIPKAKEKP